MEAEYEKLSQIQEEQKAGNISLKQAFLEREISYEALKEKHLKLQAFVESYKEEAEMVRESTEKKWQELKRIYEKQLEEL